MLVFVSPLGAVGRTRLLETDLAGRRFTDLAPPVPANNYADAIYALSRRDIWFTTFSGGGGRERLYWTLDGGRRWRSASAPSHSMSAGSTDQVAFVDAHHGWLADIQPTGPGELLFRTANSGRTWQPIAETDPNNPLTRLPTLGPVALGRRHSEGWLATEPYFPGHLYLTRDAGRHWRAAPMPRRRGEHLTTPTVTPTAVVEPVTTCIQHRMQVQLLRSIDDGRHWTATRPATVATQPGRPAVVGCLPPPVSIPTGNVAWLATVNHDRVTIHRTVDGGKHWHTYPGPDISSTPTHLAIEAADRRHAWLQLQPTRQPGDRLYLTTDGSRHWRHVDAAAH